MGIARPLRIEYAGAFYHVMNRGQSRRNIFTEDEGRQSVREPRTESVWALARYRGNQNRNHVESVRLGNPAGRQR